MRFVVLGASAAGVNGARELRKYNPEAEIIMVAEDECIYSRCILHHFIDGKRSVEELNFTETDFFSRYRINFINGVSCTALNTDHRRVILSDGRELTFDKLLIATGAGAFLPSIKGLRESKGVFGFRNLDDAKTIRELAGDREHIVILGGGLVGVDVLTGLLHLGKKPVLVELADHLLSKQLDRKAAAAYERAFEQKGAVMCLGIAIDEVVTDQDGHVQEVRLQDQTCLPCDMLIVTVGVKANIGFLKDSQIVTDQWGLVIDAWGKTNHPDIYGAGDVTGRSPIWPNAVKEGIVAARNMSGISCEMKDFFASKATMNFEQIKTMSVGFSEAPDDTYETELIDTGHDYKKMIHKDGKIYGAILQGDLSYGGILTQLIAHKIDISKVKKPVFSIDYSDFFHMTDNFEFDYEGGQL